VTRIALPYWITLLLVVLCPLFFGAVYPWIYIGIAFLAGLALLLLASQELVRGTPADGRVKSIRPAIILYMSVLAWAVIQCLPGLAFGDTHGFWSEASQILDMDVIDSISINPSLTLYAVVRLAAYGCVFLVMFWYGRDHRRARHLVAAVAAASVVYAAYGLVVYFSGSETILWYRKPSYKWSLTAVFVNRNNFAAYAGMGLICCVALLHWRLRDIWERTGGKFGLAQTASQVLVLPNAALLMGCLVLATALLLTHSRGGAATTLAGLLVFVGSLVFKRGLSPRALASMALLAAISLAFVTFLSGDTTLTRVSRALDDLALRAEVYELALSAIAERPVAGFGLGTFEDVFRLYRTPAFPERFGKVHSSYLESAVGLGLPATLLLLIAFAVPVYRCLRGVATRRRDVGFPALGLALAVQIGLHSLVDFPLQLPAVAVTYAALIAIAVAQSWPRGGGTTTNAAGAG